MLKLTKRFRKIFPKYLLAAVIIIVPLFPKFPLLAVPGTYVAIRFEDLLLFLLGLVTLANILKNLRGFLKDPLVKAFLIFFAIGLISLLSAVFLTKTAGFTVGLFNYLRRAEYLIPFFAVLTLFKPQELKDNLEFYVKILIIVTLIAFVYGLGQRYLAFPIIITQNDQYSKGVALRWTPGSHISSTFAGHYDLAAFMAVVLPIFITLFFFLKDKFSRVTLLLSIGGGLWLLINSLARISQVSYIIAVSVALLLARKFKALAVVFLLSIVLIGTSSGLKERFGRIIEVFYDKIKVVNRVTFDINFEAKAADVITVPTAPELRSNLPKPTASPTPIFEDRSTSIRLNVEWPRAIRAFKINPLLGTGYSSISLATDNDFLRMLGEIGFLGFAAFWLIFIRIGRSIYSLILNIKRMSAVEAGFAVGMTGAIIGIFIGAFFIDIFEASKLAIMFWFLVGYAVALSRIYDTE